jgi:hypothetical protein
MSMNFAREQSLLRQKLQAKASPEAAATRQAALGGTVTFLGASDADVAAAAATLAATYPQMGRAQMTAFVRTLWGSKIHELRAVGVDLLAARASLLEPADLPLLEGFLKDPVEPALLARLARDVVGTLVKKNRKLWKDLKRFASGTHPGLRLAGVHAAALPLADDAEAWPRFTDLATPLLAIAEPPLQAAIDDVLVAAVATHGDAVRAFTAQHARSVTLPKPAPAPKAPVAAPAPVAPAAETPAPIPAPKKKAAKPAAVKPAAKPPAKKAAPKDPAKVAKKPVAKSKAR